ncbi:Ribosomal large subunit pseudouridine synthase B [Myxococcus hansupus]|uniref:Pseudouridine synthase n=1 Tax=Pseudomyxococcus hansupus TaxID=1297742 RepID=A0A0H4WX23_9BACT|nr:pseudouridine synthase [Myxococcus hansupus]AKQ66168.1 Ribosomal large subunit pseudouridine synthase B [Myxococcus hansupus]
MAAERLQKYLARAGVASRRHAEELITAGRVAVNNKTVTELGSRVEPGTDLVTVDGTLVTPPDESSYFLLYKPVGVVTTLSDPQGRPTVANYVEETGKRLFPVGRLDYDAEGALLFTDDGALAHKLTHPSFQVPRTYLAKVKGAPDAATLDKLRGGVRLEDGMATPVSVGVFEAAERNTWLKIVVAEGRPHLIKRLCAAVGHPVVRLFRPAYAGVGVEGLRPGELRPLKTSEVELLNAVSDGKATPPTAALKLPPRRHGRAAPGFDSDDEEELSMDDDSPVTAKPARKAPARAAKSEGGSGLARFGRAPKSAAEGKPARRSFGGDEGGAPRGRSFGGEGGARGRSSAAGGAGRRSFGGDEGGAPRSRGAGRSFGGDEGGAPRSRGAGRPERREWSAGGDAAPRGRGPGAGRTFGGAEGKPARRSFGGDEGGAPRSRGAGRTFGGAEGKPARRSFGGDEGGAPRSRGAGRTFGGAEGKPARRSFGGDEGGAPRSRGAGRAEGGAAGGRRSFGGDEGGAPRGRTFGGAAGRAPGGRRAFGGDEGAAPRSRGAGRSFGGDEGGAPRSRGAGRSFGGDEGGAPRSRGAGRTFGGAEGGAPRGGAGRAFGGASGARRSFGGDEGGAPRSRGAGAGRPERREWSAGGDAPRSRGPRAGGEGRSFSPRGGAAGGASRAPRGEGRSFSPRGAGAGAGRPERREWKPSGDADSGPRGRGGPRREGPAGGRGASRSTWTPTDESGNPRERVVRAGARKGPPSEKSSGFQDWGKKKERDSAPRWSSNERPKGGAGRPPPRGPRRPR